MIYTNEQILEISDGAFFGIGNAQLPNNQMLMIDQINDINEQGGPFKRGFVHAELNIKPDHWFFDCHFKNDPVMPGCLGLDALWQLLGLYMGHIGLKGKGRALGVGSVKFSGQIYPDSLNIVYELDIKRIIKKPLAMGIANGRVLLNGKTIYKADDLKVGLIS